MNHYSSFSSLVLLLFLLQQILPFEVFSPSSFLSYSSIRICDESEVIGKQKVETKRQILKPETREKMSPLASFASILLARNRGGGGRGSVALRRLLFSSRGRGERTTPFPFPRWYHSADASAESVVAAGVMRKETTFSITNRNARKNARKSRFFSFAPFSSSFTTETNDDDVKTQEHEFKAETSRLLDIVTNSLYQEKEVFLRELISNSSDALEKRRHEAIKDVSEFGLKGVQDDLEFRIKISTREEEDGKELKLIVEDNGIGMSEEELTRNLGTIAKSGSKEFLENLSGGKGNDAASNIIGKFGVGFYSAFMVGKKVEVHTSNGKESFVWASEGTGKFTVSKSNEAPREVHRQ